MSISLFHCPGKKCRVSIFFSVLVVTLREKAVVVFFITTFSCVPDKLILMVLA